jgi:hypothetical protein
MALSCSACTRAELVDKANAYGEAIWDSSNKQILLNAVRASQRAPMSFVGFGDVLASPNFSGSAAGTFNLAPSALSNYSLNPTVSYGGGFSQFTKARYAQLKRVVQGKCGTDGNERTRELCDQLDEDRQRDDECSKTEVEAAGPDLTILNTAREFCSMNKFQYALRMYRLLGFEDFPGQPRSPEGILYYLGELIAAQNYSPQPYTPMTLIASGGKRRLVKLFVVERGVSANAAVQVVSNGDSFYIPRPQLGTVDEERSLQVLDLVSQAIVMATSKDSLPKTNSVSLVSVH